MEALGEFRVDWDNGTTGQIERCPSEDDVSIFCHRKMTEPAVGGYYNPGSLLVLDTLPVVNQSPRRPCLSLGDCVEIRMDKLSEIILMQENYYGYALHGLNEEYVRYYFVAFLKLWISSL